MTLQHSKYKGKFIRRLVTPRKLVVIRQRRYRTQKRNTY